MKKLTVVMFLVLGSVMLAHGQANEWVKFSSPEGYFSVSLPVQPTRQSENKELPTRDARTGAPLGKNVRFTSNLFTSRGAGEVFLVGWVDYEAGFNFDTEGELRANRDNFVKELGGELVSERKITYGSNPGLEFTTKKNAFYFKSRVYIFGKRPYILVAASGNPDVPNANKFFSSFTYTKK